MIAGHGEVGIRVLLHDQSEPPVMDSQASAIAPGKHSFMAVRQTQVSHDVIRLPTNRHRWVKTSLCQS